MPFLVDCLKCAVGSDFWNISEGFRAVKSHGKGPLGFKQTLVRLCIKEKESESDRPTGPLSLLFQLHHVTYASELGPLEFLKKAHRFLFDKIEIYSILTSAEALAVLVGEWGAVVFPLNPRGAKSEKTNA